jgi:hypothetical protein
VVDPAIVAARKGEGLVAASNERDLRRAIVGRLEEADDEDDDDEGSEVGVLDRGGYRSRSWIEPGGYLLLAETCLGLRITLLSRVVEYNRDELLPELGFSSSSRTADMLVTMLGGLVFLYRDEWEDETSDLEDLGAWDSDRDIDLLVEDLELEAELGGTSQRTSLAQFSSL